MPEDLRRRLRALARRAGLERVPDSVVLAAVVLCVLLVAWAAWRWWPRSAADADLLRPASAASGAAASQVATSPSGETASGSAGATTTASVWVHVVGAVRRPGVYELPAGARVVAALDAAGGLLGSAAPQAVNLARPVQDGEQIAVPTKDEFAKGGPPSGSPAGAAAGALGGAGGAPAGPIDLNAADAALLDTLPGVGPSTAAKIVADREANGPFASVDDLGRVTGIGPKKLDALKDLVCVR